MSQFNEVALEIYTLDNVLTMITMKCDLQQCPFLFSLEKRLVIDFSEMLSRVEKYAHIDEAYGIRSPPFALMAPML